MASPGFLSKRVKKKSQTGLTTDRYEFLGLDQAEPDLGDPLVGLSSVGANPPPIGAIQYVLVAAGGNTGKRYWVVSSQITGSGLIPGSFTIFNNNIQVGAANSFNRFNFVGSGVTVDPVGAAVTQQTGIATVRITVTDLVGPGNINSIPYKASSGLLAGATDFVYSSTNTNIGIGSTQPTVKLDVIGDTKVLGIVTTANNVSSTININTSGIITATGGFVGGLTGTASTATTATTANNVSSTININTSGIITATGGFVGSVTGNLTGTATTANNVSSTININTSGIITASSFVGNLTGTATTANNVSSTININTSGIITASTFYGTLVGSLSSTTGQNFPSINVSGLSTFTNGPVLVGTTTATGTSPQPLQVTGGAYVSGSLGIGTTNPRTPLQVETYGVKTGVGTFTASVGVSTTIDSFSVSSTDFKIAEYTVHISFGSSIQAQKVLVTQDQTTAYSQEYGVMYNNLPIVSIGATISGGNCILQATPQTGVSGLTTYRFARNTLL